MNRTDRARLSRVNARQNNAQPIPPDRGDAFMKASRFKCTGLVLDLDDAELARKLDQIALMPEVRRSLAAARGIKARFVVIAGQLHRDDTGAFTAMVMNDDVDRLCVAARLAHARLGEMGETMSQWLVYCPDAITKQVMAALAEASATEGSA